MKWIGQHIYDLVSRFRGDVYFHEDIYLHRGSGTGAGYSFDVGYSWEIPVLDTTGKLSHYADFMYDSDNEKLTIGDIDNGYAYIARTPRVAGESNSPGGWLALHAGQGTGSATGGLIELGTSAVGSSGTSLNSITEKLILWPVNNAAEFAGTLSGGVTDYVQVTMPGGLGIYADGNASDIGSQPKIILAPRTTTAQPKAVKLGEIEVKGINSAQEMLSYSLIRTTTGGTTGSNTDTDEHALFEIDVATSDGSTSSLQNAFTAQGHGADNDIDIVLGYGATSQTTIAGFLKLGGHGVNDIDLAGEFVDSDEHLMTSAAINDLIVAATSSTFVDLTSEVSGTLPVANGGTGATSLTDNKLLTGTGTSAVTAEANATYDGTDLSLTSATSTKPILSIENTTNDANAGELKLIGRRSADASVIAAIGDDAGTISFVGENSKSGPDPETIPYGKIASESSAVTDGAEMGKMTMSVGVNQSAIGGSLGFLDFMSSTASVLGETTTYGSGSVLSLTSFNSTITDFQSTASTAPIMTIRNYTDDATGPSMTFQNSRGGSSLNAPNVNGDDLGTIKFTGFDSNAASAAGITTTFAQILGEANEITNGSEEGKLTLSVASHDAELQPGLTIVSGNAEDEVDVTIGNGATSITTIAGDVQVDGGTISCINSTNSSLSLATSHASNVPFIGTQRMATGASGDDLGFIKFSGDDDGGAIHIYSKILAEIATADAGAETGKLSLQVAEYDGTVTTGLQLEGQDQDGEVDVTIGAGAASTTTVAGDLSITTGLILDSVDVTTIQTSSESFADNDTSLMTSAAIDDRIKACGLIHVDMPKYIAIYLFYIFNKDQWYTPPTYTTALTTSATIDGATLSAQMQARGANYIANSACKVKKVTLVFQMSSGTLSGDIDLEWALVKWTPQDDTANTAAMTEMTITNHDGAFTETDVHTLTFTVTDNAASTLAAKDCIAFCVRTTDQTASSPRILFYGHGNYEIELT